MEPDFQALRREFPILERKTYLNSGSYGALANGVKAAVEAYLEDRLLVGANWDAWVAKNESVRALTATLLHAAPMRSPSPPRCRPASTRWRAPLTSPVRATRWSSAISSFRPMRKSGMPRNRAAR